MKFDIKKLINGIVIVPETSTEVAKIIVAGIIAILTSYGLSLNEGYIVILGIIVKALLDMFHFWLKNKK